MFLGDLSYSNDYPYHDNVRWDTWGRFIERNAAYQPWIWTAGNHELDFAPELVCGLTLIHFERKNPKKKKMIENLNLLQLAALTI